MVLLPESPHRHTTEPSTVHVQEGPSTLITAEAKQISISSPTLETPGSNQTKSHAYTDLRGQLCFTLVSVAKGGLMDAPHPFITVRRLSMKNPRTWGNNSKPTRKTRQISLFPAPSTSRSKRATALNAVNHVRLSLTVFQHMQQKEHPSGSQTHNSEVLQFTQKISALCVLQLALVHPCSPMPLNLSNHNPEAKPNHDMHDFDSESSYVVQNTVATSFFDSPRNILQSFPQASLRISICGPILFEPQPLEGSNESPTGVHAIYPAHTYAPSPTQFSFPFPPRIETAQDAG